MGQAAAAYDEPRTPDEQSPLGAAIKQAPVIDVANIGVAAMNKKSNRLEWIPWSFTKFGKDQNIPNQSSTYVQSDAGFQNLV